MKAPIVKICNDEPITGRELLQVADQLKLLVLFPDQNVQLSLVDVGDDALDEANHLYRRIYRLEGDCCQVQVTAD